MDSDKVREALRDAVLGSRNSNQGSLMVKSIRHNDVHSFHQAVDDYLMRDELLNNVVIGLTSRMIHQGETFGETFFAHVENDIGEVVAATMVAAGSGGVILSHITDAAALPILVSAYAAAYDNLADVVGEPDTASCFAELWKQESGQDYYTLLEYGYYRLEKVVPPQNVSGEVRPATEDDFEMLVDWLIEFSRDTGQNLNHKREDAEANIRQKLNKPILGGIRIWMDEGQPVSMAAATRELPNGGNISLVYTPKALRGRGYASAVTAAVSQEILDAGKAFVCLSTDMANPTSNKIYQAIGYKFVGNHRRINFKNRV